MTENARNNTLLRYNRMLENCIYNYYLTKEFPNFSVVGILIVVNISVAWTSNVKA